MWRFAFRSLLTRPIRSLLATLGLTVAIVGMIGLFSVAGGIEAMVSDTFEQFPGLAILERGAPIPLFSRLPADWRVLISQVDGVRVVTPEVCTRANAIEGKRIFAPPRFLFGVAMESRVRLRKDFFRTSVERGRYLKPSDGGTLNTVISREIAEEFAKHVGDTLLVNGAELQIVGIYDCHSPMLDVAIVLDINQVRSIARFGSDVVCDFYVEQDDGVGDEQLRQRLLAAFRGRQQPRQSRQIPDFDDLGSRSPIVALLNTLDQALKPLQAPPQVPPQASDARADEPTTPKRETIPTVQTSNELPGDDGADLPIEVRSTNEWSELYQNFSADLDIVLSVLTGIGVTIAVLSIVNTMLMSVSERVVEFGILRANGWSQSDILKLITLESALIGFVGGVFGCFLGWSGTHIINARWPERIHLFASSELLLFGLVFSMVLGVLAGLYPAFRAARLVPMEAIRRG